MTSVRLIRPAVEYEASYRRAIADFGHERLVPYTLNYPNEDFTALIQRFDDLSTGLVREEEFVPHSTFWLVDTPGEIVGVSDLRHELTDALRRDGGHIGFGVPPSHRRKGYATKLLGLTLLEAGSLGIERALVTCSQRNVGSRKTIIGNGGVYESEEYIQERDDIVQRYWIDVPAGPVERGL